MTDVELKDTDMAKAGSRPGATTERRAATSTNRKFQTRLGGKRVSDELVTGRNAVLEALRTNIPAKHLYVMSRIEVDDRVRDIMTTANKKNLPMLEIPRSELDRLTDGAVHQGIAMQIPPYQYPDATDLVLDVMERWHAGKLKSPPLFVALDGITDPRNLGAIIRSVSAFSGDGVIIPERRSAAVTAGAWKTSAGAAARIPVAMATNLTRVLQQAKEQGIFVIGLDGGGDIDLPNLQLASEPLCVVVGSEGKGLSRLVTETCDQIVSILIRLWNLLTPQWQWALPSMTYPAIAPSLTNALIRCACGTYSDSPHAYAFAVNMRL